MVAAGRLAPVKRFELLLEAAAQARTSVPALRLRIIGELEGDRFASNPRKGVALGPVSSLKTLFPLDPTNQIVALFGGSVSLKRQ